MREGPRITCTKFAKATGPRPLTRMLLSRITHMLCIKNSQDRKDKSMDWKCGLVNLTNEGVLAMIDTNQVGSRSMRTSSCKLWRNLANFGKATTPYSREPPRHSPEFPRRPPTFTRVRVKVFSVSGWPPECAQTKTHSQGGTSAERNCAKTVLNSKTKNGTENAKNATKLKNLKPFATA